MKVILEDYVMNLERRISAQTLKLCDGTSVALWHLPILLGQ